jgi:hypothetical protein
MIFLDFATLQTRQCTDDDFEKWNARSSEGKECLMGRKVRIEFWWYPNAADHSSNGTDVESSMRTAM